MGNLAFSQFLQVYELDLTTIPDKYRSEAASWYLKMIMYSARGDPFTE